MFEKDVKIGFLLDFYGELLSERKREVLDLYYNSDLSLGEISGELGITRQAVRDLINRSGAELEKYEEKLGYARKFMIISKAAEEAAALAAGTSELLARLELIQSTIKD